MRELVRRPFATPSATAEPAERRTAVASPARLPHHFGTYALDARSTAPRNAVPIQRAVGFEFETAVPLRTKDTKKPIPYGAVVFNSRDGLWQIKADSSNIEFVTAPFSENQAGAANLETAMKGVTLWGVSMIRATQNAVPSHRANLHLVRPDAGTAKSYKKELIVLDTDALSLDSSDAMAAPQATGGVPLAQIPRLIDKMVSTKLAHLKANKRFIGPHELPKRSEYEELFPEGYWPWAQRLFWTAYKMAVGSDRETRSEAEIEYQGALETHGLTSGVAIDELQSQGYDTTDLNYAVGSGATITFLTKARRAVEAWMHRNRGQLDPQTESQSSNLESQSSNVESQSLHLQAESNAESQTSSAETKPSNLEGLLTLIVSYLIGGSKQSTALPYTKAAFTLMSRTNMHSLFKLLSSSERKLVTDATVGEIAELDMHGRLFGAGFTTQTGNDPGPTRAEWLDSVVNGTPVDAKNVPLPSGTNITQDTPRVPADRLSQRSGTAEARNSTSLGALDQPDVSLSGVQDLAVVEIRNMAKSQPLNAWLETARTVFEMFRSLHEPAPISSQHNVAEEEKKTTAPPHAIVNENVNVNEV